MAEVREIQREIHRDQRTATSELPETKRTSSAWRKRRSASGSHACGSSSAAEAKDSAR